MNNTEKNNQKWAVQAEIRNGSGTKNEVMGMIADFDENYDGDPRPLLRMAGYNMKDYNNWLYWSSMRN